MDINDLPVPEAVHHFEGGVTVWRCARDINTPNRCTEPATPTSVWCERHQNLQDDA